MRKKEAPGTAGSLWACCYSMFSPRVPWVMAVKATDVPADMMEEYLKKKEFARNMDYGEVINGRKKKRRPDRAA